MRSVGHDLRNTSSWKALIANFSEFRQHEVRRIPLLGTSVNKVWSWIILTHCAYPERRGVLALPEMKPAKTLVTVVNPVSTIWVLSSPIKTDTNKRSTGGSHWRL
jgi:hypothetical protein